MVCPGRGNGIDAMKGHPPMTAFEITERNRLLRLAKRGAYDRDEIYPIVDAGLICHVAYEIDGQPYAMPTLHSRVGDTILLHGHGTNRSLLHVGAGNPCCITVTHTDGIVLARSIFNHSINYRSAMLYGNGRLIEEREEKIDALYRFTEKLLPGRWDDVRPMTEQELKATTIIAVEIEQASSKVREGMPKDDEEDQSFPCWAGIIPMHVAIEDPVADGLTAPEMPVPEYLRAWVADRRGD
jgi:nitroimidazol reductase NimA-like FMN-containing flavoprotein (pyridoxamine 5'-phosphate oxidase superfamily)